MLGYFVFGGILVAFIILAVIIFTSKPPENFWGGYLPIPYNGQYVPSYGRYASVGDTVLIDPNASCINQNCRCVGCTGCDCVGECNNETCGCRRCRNPNCKCIGCKGCNCLGCSDGNCGCCRR